MLLPQLQKLSEAGVFLAGLNAVAGGFLRVGKLGAQGFILGTQGVVFINLTVHAVKPVDGGTQNLLDGGLKNARHVLHEADAPVARGGAESNDERGGGHNDTHPQTVLFQIILQSSSTPCAFSISPSLHSGRPMTLKKSPSIPSAKREAFP